LQNNIRYTLGKEERLKSRKAIDLLFKEGKQFSIHPFRIKYKLYNYEPANKDQSLQAGFTASSKHFKRAVDRNRIKRLIREAYRLQKNSLKDLLEEQNKGLAIFIIYNDTQLPVYTKVVEKIEAVIKRLKKILNENQQ
jgi:ribonuclease P protein component